MAKYTLTDIPVIIQAGQSNEGGHNDDGVNSTLTTTTDASIFFKTDHTSTNNGTWAANITQQVNNVHFDRVGTKNDTNQNIKLGKALFDYDGKRHYFIPIFFGGAEITDTVGQDDLNPANVGEYWTTGIDYILKPAIEKLAGLGKIRIKAISFHQGESDCNFGETVANDYYQPSPAVIDKDNPLPYYLQQLRLVYRFMNDAKVVMTKIVITGRPIERPIVQQSQIDFCDDHDWAFMNDMEGSIAYADAGVHWDAVTQELKATNVYNIIKDW